MTGVRFEKVSKSFGGVQAVADLDFAIKPGEFISLLGPSGSGKTTTLNLLAGLEQVDRGEIWIGDRVVTHLPPDRRDIAMVFQNYALYPHMTVYENLAFPLRARGRRFSEAEIEKRNMRAAEILGLTELLARFPKELSGGQQQRVALGRAMVRDPKVFLLDEPLSNLDARLRIRMRHDLKRFHEQLSSTIVYVTHDQAEAMTLSTRIAVFEAGRLQQFGSPEDIYRRPANLFVARFVGDREINLIPGLLVSTGDATHFNSEQISLELAGIPRNAATGPQQKVILGVRPENLTIATEPESGGIAASVSQIELAGPEVILLLTSANLEFCARVDPRRRFEKHQRVFLRADHEALHLFDATSGLSIPLQHQACAALCMPRPGRVS